MPEFARAASSFGNHLEISSQTRLSVARWRLGGFLQEQRQKVAASKAVVREKMAFDDALQTYRQRLADDHSLEERNKTFRLEHIGALEKSWPDLGKTDVAQISKSDCLAWAARYGEKAGSSTFNNTVGTLKIVFDIAIEAGARYDNPASHIKKKRVRQKLLQLPAQEQFAKPRPRAVPASADRFVILSIRRF
jgi:hypothetical protein